MQSIIMNLSAPDTPRSRYRRGASLIALVSLVLAILVESVLTAWLNRGIEAALLTVVFWPLCILLGAVFAVASRGSLAVRGLVILVGLAGPFIAVGILPVTTPLAEALEVSRLDASDRREERQLAFLQEYLSGPREVIFVRYPFVVVEGGFSLKLDGVSVPAENIDAVHEFLETTLKGRAVTATFPQDFLDRYSANTRRGTTDPYRRGPSRDFGDARALVSVDGMLLNQEIVRRWGHRKIR